MIDWQRVQELRAEVGPDDFAEVVQLFMEEMEEVIASLRHRPDTAKIEEDLHFIKGSALNLGFSSLAEICGGGERSAGSAAAAIVVARYEISRTEFLAGLDGISTAA